MAFDPLRDLLSLSDHLDRLRLDRLARRDGEGWMPPIDVYETADRYVVIAELAGMSRRDIEIDARGQELSLRGRRAGAGLPPNAYHQMERGQGPFERRFVFTEAIEIEQVAADFSDGVLTITVPKQGAKRIAVRKGSL
jgi:HSP20 family protein